MLVSTNLFCSYSDNTPGKEIRGYYTLPTIIVDDASSDSASTIYSQDDDACVLDPDQYLDHWKSHDHNQDQLETQGLLTVPQNFELLGHQMSRNENLHQMEDIDGSHAIVCLNPYRATKRRKRYSLDTDFCSKFR